MMAKIASTIQCPLWLPCLRRRGDLSAVLMLIDQLGGGGMYVQMALLYRQRRDSRQEREVPVLCISFCGTSFGAWTVETTFYLWAD